MNAYLILVKTDFLQRTRSYTFLITLAVSVYFAYVFVPGPDAEYVTMKIGNYVGEYNSAWIGYATALLTSTFLFMFGFFLVNSGISRDVSTGVGQIIATTSVSNFKYLVIKALSNFTVLLTIVITVMLLSMVMLVYRSGQVQLEPLQFVIPYFLVTVPSVFVVSTIAVLGEVWLPKRKILQYILFFVLFNAMNVNLRKIENTTFGRMIDPLGAGMVTGSLQDDVRYRFNTEDTGLSLGFNFGDKSEIRYFDFQGIKWNGLYLLSRFGYIGLCFAFLYIASLSFHRFDFLEKVKTAKENGTTKIREQVHQTFERRLLPGLQASFGIFPLIKSEFQMLIRKGSKWLWLPTFGLMIALVFTKLEIAHMILLPIVWFLQVSRWSDIASKETTHQIHYFTYISYRPLLRVVPAQLIAAVVTTWLIASPLMLRYIAIGDWVHVSSILAGGMFVVALAFFMGVMSGGKKLFEVFYFFLTYAHLNKADMLDYFGGLQATNERILLVVGLIAVLLMASFSLRKIQMSRA
jgi:hypothetical protein